MLPGKGSFDPALLHIAAMAGKIFVHKGAMLSEGMV
jgi:hypothetical protein